MFLKTLINISKIEDATTTKSNLFQEFKKYVSPNAINLRMASMIKMMVKM